MKTYDIDFLKTICLARIRVEAEDEDEAMKKASLKLNKYDYDAYEDIEVFEVEEED